ncbi:MAG TPA: protein kinase [Verrucomicrobiae bacterium]|nr:protein kinase [Verrucomicrobiae bacterium]
MPANEKCSRCSAPLAVSAAHGLCPACLLEAGRRLFSFAAASEKPQGPKTKASTPVGDYELLQEIARGGMGIVFKARQISLNRIVAVKALLFGEFASEEFIAMFRGEAQAAAGLQHPNIVAIHEVWQHGGQHFFSMDFVEGHTLAHLLKNGPLNVHRAARYIEVIARAVHFAHERGIIHRDLKPSNILIDAADQPRITDFGLAKRFTSARTPSVSVSLVGSPHYMSPEQSGDRTLPLSPATDVYALGGMLYHMLTGRPPFVGDSIEQILAQTIAAEPVSPRLLNQSVSRDLETICLKCLQKGPARRYVSALELADDLDRFVKNLPIHARPISRVERTTRWIRRNPAPTAVLALVTGIAIAATWASVHLQHLNREIKIGQYVSDMSVAARHLEDGDAGHALSLLKAHVPVGNSPDLRGFEWRHMWWLCRGNYDNWLPAHRQVVGTLQFGHDKILTFAWDSTARLWNTRTRANLFTFKNLSAVGGFMAGDKAFVINRPDGSVQIIDANTGATNRVFASKGRLLAFAGEIAATRDQLDRLRVWNLRDGRELLVVSNSPPATLLYSWNSPAKISPDGSKLALIIPGANALHPSREIRLWDLRTGAELKPLPANSDVRSMAFSPDGNFLLAGDGHGELRVWNLLTGQSNSIPAHSVPLLCIAFSPDGKTFATGSSDGKPIQLWDLATLTVRDHQFRGQAGDVWSLAFSPDGQQLASGTRDGQVRIWTIAKTAEREFPAVNADEYANITFSPNSRLFAAGCKDNTVKIWNVATHEIVATIQRASYVVAFSEDSERLLVSGKHGEAFWWDVTRRTSEKIPSYGGDLVKIVSVAISPNRHFAALGSQDGQIHLVDMVTGLPIRKGFDGHAGPVRSLAFSPDGKKIASGGDDMTVMVWDVQTGQRLGSCPDAHKAAVYGVAISPDGKTLASGCGAETLKLWDLNNISKQAWASVSLHRSVIRALSFSPDQKNLASASDDRTVKLWNFATLSKNKNVEVASFRFDEPLRAVQFSPDGNTLAAVTDKGTLRLLHASSLAECDRQIAELR